MVAGLVIAAAGIYQIPSIKDRLNWKWEIAIAYVDGVLNPAGALPTSLPLPHVSHQPMPSATSAQDNPGSGGGTPATAQPSPEAATATPIPTPTEIPLPASANLNPPQYEKQDQNNCGPATLTMYLRFYGWSGDQYAISNVVKPDITDRNVNVDELIYFVRTHAGWLNADYRVGGTVKLLKEFIASGMPIMIRVAIKPTPSIAKEQKTVNLKNMENAVLSVKGRHDPCVVPKAVPAIEAAIAITLADHMIRAGFIPRVLKRQ